MAILSGKCDAYGVTVKSQTKVRVTLDLDIIILDKFINVKKQLLYLL